MMKIHCLTRTSELSLLLAVRSRPQRLTLISIMLLFPNLLFIDIKLFLLVHFMGILSFFGGIGELYLCSLEYRGGWQR